MTYQEPKHVTHLPQTILCQNVDITQAIDSIDQRLSRQLDHIFHHPDFQQLEANWHGLKLLTQTQDCHPEIKIKCLPVDKKQLSQHVDYLQQLIYDDQFASAGGEPFGIVIASYEFHHQSKEIALLKSLAILGEKAFCPWIASLSPNLFELSSWSELKKKQHCFEILSNPSHTEWQSLRQLESTRFLVLTLPRLLARRPHQSDESYHFNYNEGIKQNNEYCWMSSAFGMGQCIIAAFKESGWTTAIRGAENGGKLNFLPLTNQLTPTDTILNDRYEHQLSQNGLLALCHYKNTDYAVFFGAQTLHQPKVYQDKTITENAAITARLPYVLASSRFAHYLKVMVRDKIGSFNDAESLSQWLNHWIQDYVNANPSNNASLRSKYPLAEAKITVEPIPEKPGTYYATVLLKPWLQLESLHASIQMVTPLNDTI